MKTFALSLLFLIACHGIKLVGLNKTFEDVTLMSLKLWWAFTIFGISQIKRQINQFNLYIVNQMLVLCTIWKSYHKAIMDANAKYTSSYKINVKWVTTRILNVLAYLFVLFCHKTMFLFILCTYINGPWCWLDYPETEKSPLNLCVYK